MGMHVRDRLHNMLKREATKSSTEELNPTMLKRKATEKPNKLNPGMLKRGATGGENPGKGNPGTLREEQRLPLTKNRTPMPIQTSKKGKKIQLQHKKAREPVNIGQN